VHLFATAALNLTKAFLLQHLKVQITLTTASEDLL